MKPEKFHRHASFFMCKTTNRQKISGGGKTAVKIKGKKYERKVKFQTRFWQK